ncbi:MAG: hypothetical protein HC844_19880 [Tabrizicola sp.]|nr:hypothetical protein [Tabrizicola sp.]
MVFYFSGHGSQAPDMSGDEGGGYDEILLPADAAGWKGAIGAVENAILDDELQAWAQPMLAAGLRLSALSMPAIPRRASARWAVTAWRG